MEGYISEITLAFEDEKSNGPLGRGMGAPPARKRFTVFGATVIALSSLLQTLLTEDERLDLSFGAMMAFWWSALAACL